MDLWTMGNGGDYKDDDGGTGRGLARRLDGAERRKGKTRTGTVSWILLPVWTVGTHGKELRVNSNRVLQLRKVGTHGKVVT